MVLVTLFALRGGGSPTATRVSTVSTADPVAPRQFHDLSSRSLGPRSFDAPLLSDAAAMQPAAVVAGAASAVPAAPPTPLVAYTSSGDASASGDASTGSPASSAAPPSAVARHRSPPTTRSSPATTTTTTTTAPARPSQTGPASWYPAPAGTCAHPSLPFGTVVTVTDLANGRTTTCRVEDRGPYEGGRIIDLSESTFAQLAPPSTGVIQVRITW
jgi:rare lipoprotein A